MLQHNSRRCHRAKIMGPHCLFYLQACQPDNWSFELFLTQPIKVSVPAAQLHTQTSVSGLSVGSCWEEKPKTTSNKRLQMIMTLQRERHSFSRRLTTVYPGRRFSHWNNSYLDHFTQHFPASYAPSPPDSLWLADISTGIGAVCCLMEVEVFTWSSSRDENASISDLLCRQQLSQT